MHPLPRQTLRQLLANFGPTLLNDPVRVDALLADLWGPYHSERFLLFHAAKLLAQHQGHTVHVRRLSRQLQERYGFTAEAAHWAVESWSAVLDIDPLNPNAPRDGNDIHDSSRTEFSESPIGALCQLLTDWGPALINEPARMDALIADFCGQLSRERFLLLHALREQAPAEILVQQQDDAGRVQWLSQRLQSRYGFTVGASNWAIEGWSLALKSARSGQNLKFEEEQATAEATTHRIARELDEANETARRIARELDKANETARRIARELDKANETARRIARELDKANETARQKKKKWVLKEEVIHRKVETLFQNLQHKCLTSREVATILVIKQELAVRWLGRLREGGEIELVWLKRSPHYPYYTAKKFFHNKHSRIEAWANCLKEETVRKSNVVWKEAQAATAHIKSKLDKANAEIREKTKELDKAEVAAHKKEEELDEAKEEARQKEQEQVEAERAACQKAEERKVAEEVARCKAKEWDAAEDGARQIVGKRAATEDEIRRKASEWREVILQSLKRNPLTSRELATILKTEQEHTIALLKQLLQTDQIEFTWSQRSPYTPCYQIRNRPDALTPAKDQNTPAKDQSSPRQRGWLWLLLWLLPALLLLALLLWLLLTL